MDEREGPLYGGHTIAMPDAAFASVACQLNVVNDKLELLDVDDVEKVVDWFSALNEHPTISESIVADFNELFAKVLNMEKLRGGVDGLMTMVSRIGWRRLLCGKLLVASSPTPRSHRMRSVSGDNRLMTGLTTLETRPQAPYISTIGAPVARTSTCERNV